MIAVRISIGIDKREHRHERASLSPDVILGLMMLMHTGMS
jgi:hypothetical protein